MSAHTVQPSGHAPATGDRPLRVWHVNLCAQHLPVDGITQAIDRLAANQRELGHLVSIVRTGDRGPLATAATLLRVAKVARPDVVHLHSVFRPAHAYLAVGLRALGIAYVTSPHSGLAPDGLARDAIRKRVYVTLIEKHVLRRARAVLCLTATEVGEVLSVMPQARTALAPNGVPAASDSTSTWSPAPGRPVLVSLSRFDVWQKGLDRLTGIAATLPEVDVAVYGAQDANQPERTEALRASAPGNFELRSPVFGKDKADVLARAALYVQTSRWEGLSMSVIEAMAAGVPVAVSSYIATSMGLTDQSTAFVLDDDPAAAAGQVRAALSDPNHLAAVATAGQDYVRRMYDPHAAADAAIAAYRHP